MFHPFFLVFWFVVEGELQHNVYKDQGHIYGFATKVACEKVANRIIAYNIPPSKVAGVDFAFTCMKDEGEAYSGGGEYEEEWDKHRWDGWA